MIFIRQLKSSVYDPPFYAQAVRQPLGKTLRFFFKLVLLLVLLNAISVAVSFFSSSANFNNNFSQTIHSIADGFPDELEVKVKDGQVTTNVQEPYFIKLPKDDHTKQQNLIVIDTKTPFSSEKLNDYNTIAWLTKDSLIMGNKGGASKTSEIRVLPLADIKDLSVNQKFVNELVDKYSPLLKLVIPLFVIFGLMALFLFHTAKLLYLLFAALIIMLGVRLLGSKLDYGQSYRVAIFATATAFILQTLLRYTLHLPWPPFTTSLLMLALALINLNKTKSSLPSR